MEHSIAHRRELDAMASGVFSPLTKNYPDGLAPWLEATPPDLENGRTTGDLRRCSFCGSMHPADVAEAIRAGAVGHWADRKYGWPHKAYFEGVPNPHAGMLESRSSSNQPYRDYVQVGPREWREPGRPTAKTVHAKFYSVHLKDATPEDREVIEKHLGLHFAFTDDGKVGWYPVLTDNVE